MKEGAMARVRCAWAKFKELSPILMAMWCIIPHKGKDIQGLCPDKEFSTLEIRGPACIGIWD